jgi:transcriptional regulator NrdR family protein
MFCIKCSARTNVINSRHHKKTLSVWRRRRCTSCGTTFTTNEGIADNTYPLVVVDKKIKTPFSLPRLSVSLFHLFSHHDVTTAAEESYWLAKTIAQEAQASASDDITKQALITITHDVIRRYDELAGMQYGVKHHLVSLNDQKPSKGRPRQFRRPT